MIGYVTHFTNKKNPSKVDKRMSFKTFDEKLFKKYTKIWEKISNLVGKEFNSKMYYEDDENDVRYINSKISIINREIKTDFHGYIWKYIWKDVNIE